VHCCTSHLCSQEGVGAAFNTTGARCQKDGCIKGVVGLLSPPTATTDGVLMRARNRLSNPVYTDYSSDAAGKKTRYTSAG
jgi:hypothetical protein